MWIYYSNGLTTLKVFQRESRDGGRKVLLTGACGPSRARRAGGTGHTLLYSSSSPPEAPRPALASRGSIRVLQVVGRGASGRRSGGAPRVHVLGPGCLQPPLRTGAILRLRRARAKDDGQAGP